MSKELSPELQAQIEQEAKQKYSPARQAPYIAGATEYAPYKVRCEKALQYIGDMHSSGCIELNNYHINEIQKLLDGK